MSKSEISIMSLNLLTSQFRTFRFKSFSKRCSAIKQMIQQYKPDIIGVQELNKQMFDNINDLFDAYTIVGDSRHSKYNDEFCSILFKKDKFELLDSRTLWLSNSPTVIGSKHPFSQFPRIVTYAHLKEKKTNKLISVYNTHLDSNFELVRHFQARALSKIIQDTQKGEYTILTGDFNCNSLSSAYQIIQTPFIDVVDDSIGSTLRGTIGSIRYHHIPIDHIFVSNNCKASQVKKITSQYSNMNPTDHFPVFAKCVLK